MLPYKKDTQSTSECTNGAKETALGDTSLRSGPELDTDEVCQELTEEATQRNGLNNETSFQQHREWPSLGDEMPEPPSSPNLLDFNDGHQDALEFLARNTLGEDMKNLPDPELNLQPFQYPKQEGSTSSDLDSKSTLQYKKSEDTPNEQPAQEPKPHKKVGRKRINTGLTQRKDIVLKKVLRKIRNYYLKDFKACTQFAINRKDNHSDSIFKDCLESYILQEFSQDSNLGMLRALRSFLFAKESNLKDELIYETLYRCSFARLQRLAKNIHFRYLIQRYFEKVETETLTADESIGLAMIVSMTVKP